MAQAEFPPFKQLLKQLYNAHSSKVKELENEIKILKEKLAEKERESNANLTECKRCIELEEAFKSCKKALLDQSKLFENFGQKFSIFNSPGFENQDSKDARKSSSDSPEETNNLTKLKHETPFLDNSEPASLLSLEGNTITEIKINATDKVPVVSNKNLFKKVMHDDENLESFDVCTVTFPQHLKQGLHSAKFDSLVLAPDSLDTSLDDKRNKQCDENNFKDCPSETELKLSEVKNLKDNDKFLEDKSSGKRLSSDSLNDDRIKRKNIVKEVDIAKDVEIISSKHTKSKDIKNCFTIPPKITVTQETSHILPQMDRKNSSVMKEVNAIDTSVPKKKKASLVLDNKIETLKNSNPLNTINKIKLSLNETSPSLLPTNTNAQPKRTINLEDISSDNDDFQEQFSSAKITQNDDLWDACDKKKSIKKRVIKNIKTTSKYKMTLDAPPLNFKKPNYKQTKLSKSIFQPKSCSSNKNSCNKLSEVENINPIVIDDDSSPTIPQNNFLTSSPYDAVKSPSAIDIDATFVPENFHLESRQCTTTSVKKNAVEKSHLRNGSLFSNISFPEELQAITSEDFLTNENGNEDYSHCEDLELKENMNSFDRLPVPEEPAYRYKNDVVRKKSERKQLNGFDCKECEKYYSELGLSDREKKERMKKCSRHRGKFTPPSTPDHFWELEFPDTQECKARGYMDKTQKVKLNEICNF